MRTRDGKEAASGAGSAAGGEGEAEESWLESEASGSRAQNLLEEARGRRGARGVGGGEKEGEETSGWRQGVAAQRDTGDEWEGATHGATVALTGEGERAEREPSVTHTASFSWHSRC